MGHYSHTCKLSNLPITGGTPVVLFPMVMSDRIYDNSEKSLKKYGKTYMCSNDGTRLKFIPCYLPIMGEYDEYGGIENIVESESTKALEQYFDLTIQEICNVITSNRKDDGYDNSLNCIKDPNAKDENGNKLGDEDYEDYNKPNYLDRYKELLKVSGMWIHGDVYEKLTNKKEKVDEYGGLDLGTPSYLKALGFTEIENGTDPNIHDSKRYNRRFQKGNLVVHSDGTWVSIKNEQIYNISDFAKYCEKQGEPIENLESFLNKTYIEQLYDYVIQNCEKFYQRPKPITATDEEIEKLVDKRIIRWKKLFDKYLDRDEAKEDVIESLQNGDSYFSPSRDVEMIAYKLLNTGGYSSGKITNPMVYEYYDACKQGLLRDELRRFWAFETYLYATGTFYDIVGTSPQDGEIDLVKEVIDISKTIADQVYGEYHEDDEE